jgi:4-hydroxy-2-oxoheptanedioate aldolase
MSEIRNPARERLAKGEVSLGIGVRIARGVEIARSMQSCGYDWLFIDLEHGSASIETAAQIAAASLDAGIAPLVRVPKGQYDMATRMLDSGAWGIVMPHVDDAEEAAEAVRRLKYPPQGHRSVAGGLAHFGYKGVKVGDSSRIINENMLLTLMVETPEAIHAADAIAAVPGVDVVLIGTNDLAMEMGIPGDVGNQRIVAAYETVIGACKRHGKWAGMGGVYTEDLMKRYIGMGMRMILCGNDLSLLMTSATQRATALRG